MGLDDLERTGRKLAADASQRAALNAGRELARRALDDLALSPEERAARDARQARSTKQKLGLAVVGVTVVGVVAIGLMQLIASLWLYAIGLVVVGGLGGVAFLLLRPRLEAVRQRLLAARSERAAAAQKAAEEQQRQQALAQAAQAKRQAAERLEDELARLKQQAGR